MLTINNNYSYLFFSNEDIEDDTAGGMDIEALPVNLPEACASVDAVPALPENERELRDLIDS